MQNIIKKDINMKTKRTLVTLDNEQWSIINGIKGLGYKDSEKLKSIIIAYLSEKGFLEKKR